MRTIVAGYKNYNANSKHNHTSDCVKRSLMLAYGLDYDDVSNELNAIKRKYNLPKFNIRPVYGKFIENHGLVQAGRSSQFVGLSEGSTVTDFCNKFSDGVFILLVGETKSSSDHMVCVIDGDFWDSWDCSDRIVNYIYVIESGKDSHVQDVDVSNIKLEIKEYIKDFLSKTSQSKMPYAEFVLEYDESLDNYTHVYYLTVNFNDEYKSKLGYLSFNNLTGYFSRKVVIKLHPRQTIEDNLTRIKSKLHYQLREWAYSVRKEIQDDIAKSELKTHPNFSGDESVLLKLPENMRTLLKRAEDRGSNEYSSRYYAEMDNLPDDPRADECFDVTFYAESIKELKTQIENYQKHFWRFNYDY